MHPHKSSGVGCQQLIRFNNPTGLHIGHQRLPLRIWRRIASSSRQACYQSCAFDPLGIDAPRSGVVADKFCISLEAQKRLDFGALAPDRGPSATHQQRRCGEQAVDAREKLKRLIGETHRWRGSRGSGSTEKRGNNLTR